MTKMIFVNLPVTDLARSTAFYEALGAVKNPQFSDDTASGMVFSDAIHVMLLTHEKFSGFIDRTIVDAKTAAQAGFCLSADSRDAVDAFVAAGAAAGGEADPNPVQDFGFMYGRGVADPDGHIWETMYMDMAAFEQAASQEQVAPQLQPA